MRATEQYWRQWLLPLFWALLLTCGPGLSSAMAQYDEADLRITLARAEDLYTRRKYDSILPYAERALVISQLLNDKEAESYAEHYKAQALRRSDPEASLQWVERSLESGQDLEAWDLRAQNWLLLGSNKRLLAEYASTIQAYDSAETYALKALAQEDSRENRLMLGKIDVNRMALFYQIGAHKEALEYGMKAAEIARVEEEAVMELHILVNLSGIMTSIGNHQAAIDYDRQALSLGRQLEEVDFMATLYHNLGTNLSLLKEVDSAVYYLDESVRISRERGEMGHLAMRLISRGGAYGEQGRDDESMRDMKEALEVARALDDPVAQVLAGGNIGYLLMHEGKLEEAEDYMLEALDIALEIHRYNSIRDSYERLAELEEKKGETGKALQYLKLHLAYKDSAVQESHLGIIEEQQARFDTERKVLQIKTLTKEKEISELTISRQLILIFALGFGLLAVAAIVYILLQKKVQSERNRVLQTEQRLLRAQINPHFFFNVLSGIQSYLLAADNPMQPARLLAKFAKLMRSTLESASEETVSLLDDSEMMENYLSLQQMRYQGKFEFKIEVDSEVDPEAVFLPPMICQPFIENALEHGIRPLSSGGMVRVSYTVAGDQLRIAVEDNGVGREAASRDREAQGKGHRSRAIQITRDRLFLVRRRTKREASVDIRDLEKPDGRPGGTLVEILLPVEVV